MNQNFSIPADVTSVIGSLEKRGYKAYIVGGAVRDMLLGKTPHDYDITTNATPEEIKSVFAGRCVTFAEKFGTVTVLENGEEFEVTTFRRESGYSDSRHPDKVEWGKTIEEDLGRRDFTINAIAMDKNGKVIDPFGGQKDLANGFIRCVGNPKDRFKEDNLRILRAARFASLFDGAGFDSETAKAMESYGGKKLNLSVERVRDEFTKMLMSDNPNGSFNVLYRLGILKSVLPEVNKIRENPSKRQYVIDALKAAVAIRREPNLRWGLLLSCVETPEKVVDRLKFSNKDKEEILFYAKNKTTMLFTDLEIRKFVAKNKDCICNLCGMQEVLCEQTLSAYEWRYKCRKYLDDGSAILPSELKIDGNDLMELGFNGKEIGEIKNALYDEVLKCPELNTKEKLMSIAKDYADGEIER